jgi:hypothetical protein
MAEKKAPRHKRMYKDSPKLERGEDGNMKSVKPSDKRGEEPTESEKEADKVQSGTDGMQMHESHAASRRSMHHRHLHEHTMMHHQHELEHAHHKGDKASVHEKHEKEYADMHKRHHTEMKSLHKSHGKEGGEKGGEEMIDKSKETAE